MGLAISETEKLFVGVTGGVYNSTDWGINWDQVLSISQVWVGVIFILNGQNIFAGSRGEGIFLSTDNGNNWNIINNGLKNFYVNAFCGSSNGYVYAGSDSGVFITSSPIVSINSEKSYLATGFSLFQNYPNPFNPTTKISWQSPVGSYQTLRIYDVLGNEVATLVNEYKPAGSYEVEFNGHSDGGQNLSSGVYFYQLRAGSFVETKKMLLTK
ncbi:MAG TPA: T9SS type A sorting domain-containing protein [Ignavibacteriaceae bacterium]|nr:T9SS type A sorting domain-containing protein [Ignavibacteriaceae bacterium]